MTKKRKRISRWILLAVLPWLAPELRALPDGEQVTSGSVTFSREGDELRVIQDSARAIVNYNSFSIAQQEAVRFLQPGSSAAILNRVVGGGASVIAGMMQANGIVYLVNPQGILFSSSARVDVHGLVASGLQMNDADFMSGRNFFFGGGGAVRNEGELNGAFVYLVGGSTENDGSIIAGDVVLAAGRQSVLIDNTAGGELRLIVDGKELGPDREALSEIGSGGGTDDVASADTEESEESGPSESDGDSSESGLPDVLVDGTGPESGSVDLPSGLEDSEVADLNAAEISALETELQPGDVVIRGVIRSESEMGGQVLAAGNRVGQLGLIDVIVPEGRPGTIRVYGDEFVDVAAESVTRANPENEGDGGEIRFHAMGSTRVDRDATIEARGRGDRGRGGFVEVSGEERLALDTVVDVSAESGENGMLLIDPADVTITSSETNSGGAFFPTSPPFTFAWTNTSAQSSIDVQQLETQLGLGSVVVTTTESPESESGSTGVITVNSLIEYTGPTSTLSLLADSSVIFTEGVSSVNNPLNLEVHAGSNVMVNASIDTLGGSIVFEAGDEDRSGGIININNFGTTITGGEINFTAEEFFSRGELQAESGSVNVTVTGVLDGFGGVVAADNIALRSMGSGDVTLSGDILSLGGGNISIENTDGKINVEFATVKTVSDGEISIVANTGTGDIVIGSGIIESLNGNVSLKAGQDLSLTEIGGRGEIVSTGGNIILHGTNGQVYVAVPVETGGNGTIDILGSSLTNTNSGDGEGSFSIGTITNASGDITIRTTGPGGVEVYEEIRSVGGNITMNSEGGGGHDLDAPISSDTGNIALRASSNVIQTVNAPLTAGGSTGITVHAGTGFEGDAELLATNGNITVETEAGPFQFTGEAEAATNMTFRNVSGDISVEGLVSNRAGNISLLAGSNLTLTANSDLSSVTSVGGNIILHGTNGQVHVAVPVETGGDGTINILGSSFVNTISFFDSEDESVVEQTGTITSVSGDIDIRTTGPDGVEVFEGIGSSGGNITINGANGQITVAAPVETSGDGTINILGSSFSNTISFRRSDFESVVEQTGTITSVSGDIDIRTTGPDGVEVFEGIGSSGGDITINGTDGQVTVAAPVETSGEGTINILGSSFVNTISFFDSVVEQTGTITSASGDIDIRTTGPGGVEVDEEIRSVGGNITINGTNGQVTVAAPVETGGDGTINILGSSFVNTNSFFDSEDEGVFEQTGTITSDLGDIDIRTTGPDGVEVYEEIRSAGGNVTMNSEGGGGHFLDAPISSDTANIALRASSNVIQTVNAPLTAGGSTGITVHAGTGFEGDAELLATNGNITVETEAGPFQFTGESEAATNMTFRNVAGDISVEGLFSNQAGNISLLAGSNLTLTANSDFSAVTSVGGNIILHGTNGQVYVAVPVETGGEGTIDILGSSFINTNFGDGESVFAIGAMMSDLGDIDIRTTGPGGVEVYEEIRSDGGTITIDSEGGGGHFLDAPISSDTGNIALRASSDVIQTVNAPLTGGGSTGIAVHAGTGFEGDAELLATNGNVTVETEAGPFQFGGDAIAATDITFRNVARDISVEGLVSNQAGNISLLAGSNLTLTANSDFSEVTSVGGNIILHGTNGQVYVAVPVETGGDGTIDILGSSFVNTNSGDGESGFAIGTITSDSGDIDIRTTGPGGVEVDEEIRSVGGNITIDSEGGGGHDLDAPISSDTGNIALRASSNVMQTVNAPLTAGGSTGITVHAGTGFEGDAELLASNGNVTVETEAGLFQFGGDAVAEADITFRNVAGELSVEGLVSNQAGNISLLAGSNLTLTANSDFSAVRSVGGNIILHGTKGQVYVAVPVETGGDGTIDILGASLSNTISVFEREDGSVAEQWGTITSASGDIAIRTTGPDGVEVFEKIGSVGGNITINGTNGQVTVAAPVETGGDGTIDIFGSSFVNTISVFDSGVEKSGTITSASGDIAIRTTGPGGAEVDEEIRSVGGNITINSEGGGHFLDGPISSDIGNVALRASSNVIQTVNAPVTAGGSTGITVHAGTGFEGDAELLATNGNITVETEAGPFQFGGDAIAATDITFRNVAGDISVEGLVSNQAGNISLLAGSNLTLTANSDFSAVRSVGGNIILHGTNRQVYVAVPVETGGNGTIDILGSSFINTNSGDGEIGFAIGTIASDSGDIDIRTTGPGGVVVGEQIATDSGNITISSRMDALIRDDLDSDGGDITVRAFEDVRLEQSLNIKTTGDGAVSLFADSDMNNSGSLMSPSTPYTVETKDGSIIISGADVDTDQGTFMTDNSISLVSSGDLTLGLVGGFSAKQIVGNAGGNVVINQSLSVDEGLLGFDAKGAITVGDSVTLSGQQIGLKAASIGAPDAPVVVNAEDTLLVISGDVDNVVVNGNPSRTGTLSNEPLVLPSAASGQPVAMVDLVVNEPPEPPSVAPPLFPASPLPVIDLPPMVSPQEQFALEQALAAVVRETPGARALAVQFYLFYFLHQSVQSSEYVMELDLNFIDYILFGTAKIVPDPLMPDLAKRTIYIGGEKPFNVKITQ